MARVPELDHDLLEPIMIAIKGEQQERNDVTLIAPAGKHRKWASRIKLLVQSAMMKTAENSKERIKGKDESPEESTIKGSDLVMMLSSVPGVEENFLENLYDLFAKLMCKGCGKIGGIEFNETIFDKLSLDDIENMFGEYCVNFLLRSLMERSGGTN